VVPRNFVVMEVKENLVAEDRAAILKRFPRTLYKRVAKVVMGEPKAEFKSLVKEKILKQKQVKAEQRYMAQKAEKERNKLAEQRKKEAAEKHKAIAEARKKAAEEKQKKE